MLNIFGCRQPMFDVAAHSRRAVSGLDSSSPAWGKHPIASARLPNIFSGHSQQKTLPKWKAVISDKQQQIKEASVNILKNLFLEEWAGRSDAKSGLAGRCHHRLWLRVY
jgi:hypothetical protein